MKKPIKFEQHCCEDGEFDVPSKWVTLGVVFVPGAALAMAIVLIWCVVKLIGLLCG